MQTTRPVLSVETGYFFLLFCRTGRANHYNNCSLGKVLTDKNLIYLLNLQVFVYHCESMDKKVVKVI